MQLFTVRDTKSKSFHRPFTARTPEDATRILQQNVNDPNPQNLMNQYPEDFDLWLIGNFDELTGQLVGLPAPEHVVKAIALKRNAQ